ncbi:hypothetical protein [Streptomyces glomeratus]|uniref:Uncharacterized protein n=1 Tax=Streptomyces glomeratus TaxID=284452 RepID=A0ABP6M356_9ACTN|nr:hypothetical protein [Streptomyces glomeratus]MCF1512425.1 hypothetical protein [Streptomyces glomeratus]
MRPGKLRSGLRLVCADAVAHLRDADPYDLTYSDAGADCMRGLRSYGRATQPSRTVPLLYAY